MSTVSPRCLVFCFGFDTLFGRKFLTCQISGKIKFTYYKSLTIHVLKRLNWFSEEHKDIHHFNVNPFVYLCSTQTVSQLKTLCISLGCHISLISAYSTNFSLIFFFNLISLPCIYIVFRSHGIIKNHELYYCNV